MAARRTVNATAAKLSAHEEICAERYTGIMSRIGRLERVLMGSATAMIGALVYAVWQMSHLAGAP